MRYRFVIGERPQGPWHANRLRAVEDAVAAGFAVRGPTRNHVVFQESARIEVTRARKGQEDRAAP